MADLGFRVSFSWVLIGLCILGFSFVPEVFAAGAEKDEGDNHKAPGKDNNTLTDYDQVRPPPQGTNNIGGGSISGTGYGEGQRFELCDTDLKGILAPPYGNISNMICSPIWNTFLLRVSFLFLHEICLH